MAVREFVVRVMDVAIRARMLETATADGIWDALAIYSTVNTWGEEVYFDALVPACALEPGAKSVVKPGEIAFWPERGIIAIGFGPTPISVGNEIRLASPCNIFAVAVDDVTRLRGVPAGEPIAVLRADS